MGPGNEELMLTIERPFEYRHHVLPTTHHGSGCKRGWRSTRLGGMPAAGALCGIKGLVHV